MNWNSVHRKTFHVLTTKCPYHGSPCHQHLRVLHLFITYFSQPQLFSIHALHRLLMCAFTCIEHSNHHDSQADLTFRHTSLCWAQTQTLGRHITIHPYTQPIIPTIHLMNVNMSVNESIWWMKTAKTDIGFHKFQISFWKTILQSN